MSGAESLRDVIKRVEASIEGFYGDIYGGDSRLEIVDSSGKGGVSGLELGGRNVDEVVHDSGDLAHGPIVGGA